MMSATNAGTVPQTTPLNLSKVLDELFLVLSEKEKEVIDKRFALDGKHKQTLEKIGRHFSVTRERIRQIEHIALQKLRRNIGNTQLQRINKLAKEILEANGGVMKEEKLLAEIINMSHIAHDPVTGSIIKLSMTIDNDLTALTTSKVFYPFWSQKSLPLSTIEKIAAVNYKTLKKFGDLTTQKNLLEKIQQSFGAETVSPAQILSILTIDRRMSKLQDEKWGLMEWRHVNPKSIRDKALIILKKTGKPLHFVEIANQISQTGFDKKVVTVQAVHNELIRYPHFVLVGRGMYALAEWGYQAGTVSDVLARILKEKGPLKKKDVVKELLKQRDVKLGTISLNLQKNPAFIRVGRAVYDFDESAWRQPKRGRGRAKMNLES